MRQRPTLPLIGSTIGAEELNGRVRYGNGWDLLAVITSSKLVWNATIKKGVLESVREAGQSPCQKGLGWSLSKPYKESLKSD